MAKVLGRMVSSCGRIHTGTLVEVIEGYIDEHKEKMSIVVVPHTSIQETVPTALVHIHKIIRGE